MLVVASPAGAFEQTITPHGFVAGGHGFVVDVGYTSEVDGASVEYSLRRLVWFDGRETESWQMGTPRGPVPAAWDAAGSVEMGRRVLADRRVVEAQPLAGTLDGSRAVVTATVCASPADAPTDRCPTCMRRDTRWRTVLIDGRSGAVVTLGSGQVTGAGAPAAAMTRCPTIATEVFWADPDRVAVIRREHGATRWDALSLHDLSAPGTTMGASPVTPVARADDRAAAARRLLAARAELPGATDRAAAMLAVADAALDAGDLGLAWDYFDAAHTLTDDDRAAVGRALVAFIGGTGTRDELDRLAGPTFAEARALAAWLDGDDDGALAILGGRVPIAVARRVVAFDLEAGIRALTAATDGAPGAEGSDELFDALLASGDHGRIGPWIPQDGLEDPHRLARLLRGARAVGRHADVLALTPAAILEHPEICAFHEVLGLAHLDVGDAANASPWLAAATACDPDAEEATAALALAMHLSGAFDAAVALARTHRGMGDRAGDPLRAERMARSAWIATADAARDVILRRASCVPDDGGLQCTLTVTHGGDVSVDPVQVAGWMDGAEALLFDQPLGLLSPGETRSWDLSVPGPLTGTTLQLEVRPEGRHAEATVIAVRIADGANVTDLAQAVFGP